MLKKFENLHTFKTVYEMMVYSHSKEVENANIEDLKDFILHFLDTFPKTDKGDGFEPYDEENLYMVSWRATYTRLTTLLSEKEKIKNQNYSFVVAACTLVVLVLTLFVQSCSSIKSNDQQAPKCTSEVSKNDVHSS